MLGELGNKTQTDAMRVKLHVYPSAYVIQLGTSSDAEQVFSLETWNTDALFESSSLHPPRSCWRPSPVHIAALLRDLLINAPVLTWENTNHRSDLRVLSTLRVYC
jgi:uncharacterized protein Veg